MIETLIWVVVGLSAVNLALLGVVLVRLIGKNAAGEAVQDGLRSLREDVAKSDREIRNEIRASQETTANTLVKTVGELGATQGAPYQERNRCNRHTDSVQRKAS